MRDGASPETAALGEVFYPERGAELGGPVKSCDLCWIAMEAHEYVIAELRVVCATCMERFQDEYDSRLPSHKLNFTIGLCERGLYAAGRPDPGPNGLGGRE